MMKNELRNRLPRLLRVFGAGVVGAALLGYVAYASYGVFAGPSVTIGAPENGAALSRSDTVVSGTTERVTHITLNDRKIFVDEEGRFAERLLLSHGYNILTLKANDRFDREITKTIEVIYR